MPVMWRIGGAVIWLLALVAAVIGFTVAASANLQVAVPLTTAWPCGYVVGAIEERRS